MQQLFKPSKRLGATLLTLFFGGFVLNFIMQAASLNLSLGRVLSWISQYYWLYISGSLFFFFVLLTFAAIIPNVYSGALFAFLVCCILAVANYKKLSTTKRTVISMGFDAG